MTRFHSVVVGACAITSTFVLFSVFFIFPNKLTFGINASTQLKELVLLTELHPDAATEWFELHNPTTAQVSLAGWQVWDQLSTPSQLLTLEGTLQPAETKVFQLPISKLNNSGDGITLIDASGQEITRASYTYSEPQMSWSLIGETWQLENPSPGFFSQTLPSSSPTPAPSATGTPTPSVFPTPQPTPSITPSPSPSQTPEPQPTPSVSIVSINPCPSTGNFESLTIRNDGSHVLELTELLFSDAQQNTRTTTGVLNPGDTTQVGWQSAMLNNTGDTITVYHKPTNFLLDQASYASCETDQIITVLEQSTGATTAGYQTPSAAPTATSLSSLSTISTPSAVTNLKHTMIEPNSTLTPPNSDLPTPLLLTTSLDATPNPTPPASLTELTLMQSSIPLYSPVSAILGSVLMVSGSSIILSLPKILVT
ncbi:lamin tail domain-containing protein [Candidatus Woesebacteria bacterium]|nr:lamin tail domain-containing protein [Candidatus Woesebacteria bacterium]